MVPCLWVSRKDKHGSIFCSSVSPTEEPSDTEQWNIDTSVSGYTSKGGFPGGTSGKEPACRCRKHGRLGFYAWAQKIPWRRAWQPTPVFSPGESHGQRSLAGYSPQGYKELDTTEATEHTSKGN